MMHTKYSQFIWLKIKNLYPGGCTPYDYIAHVRSKFYTPKLHAIDNF